MAYTSLEIEFFKCIEKRKAKLKLQEGKQIYYKSTSGSWRDRDTLRLDLAQHFLLFKETTATLCQTLFLYFTCNIFI